MTTVVKGQVFSVNVTEYAIPTPNSQPDAITVGLDGALWFTESGGGGGAKIGRLMTSGLFTEYSVPLGAPLVSGKFLGPNSITSGPDGALWFTFTGGIGRITTNGVVTEFTNSFDGQNSFSQDVEQITAGSDGALWFIDPGNGTIGRISTGGAVTKYFVPNAGNFCGLRGMTSGPDGAIWFVDFCNNSIGRMSTAGVLTEYPASLGSNALSVTLTVGPDNALWFATGNNSIGRITTTGVVTEYPVGVNIYPLAITKGADGALWFTTNWATNGLGPGPLIGRITTAGEVTTYHVPDYSGAANDWFRITLGPDGALWYPEAASNKIARLQVPARTGVFSHVAAGGGWSTIITLVNTSPAAIQATVALHSDNGTALSLPVTTTQNGVPQITTTSSVDAAIGPNSTMLISMGDQVPSTMVGWADVTSTGPLGGFAIFRQTPQTGSLSEGTVPLQTQFPSSFSLPYDDTAGFIMGVAVANLSAASATVTATIWDDSGNQLGTQNITIPGSGHTAFALPTQIALTAGKRGIVQFKSSTTDGLAGLGLRFSPFGTLTSVPTIY